ncbi:hypothetical protein PMIN03_002347 [Paraphaeosphaeria minitans]
MNTQVNVGRNGSLEALNFVRMKKHTSQHLFTYSLVGVLPSNFLASIEKLHPRCTTHRYAMLASIAPHQPIARLPSARFIVLLRSQSYIIPNIAARPSLHV